MILQILWSISAKITNKTRRKSWYVSVPNGLIAPRHVVLCPLSCDPFWKSQKINEEEALLDFFYVEDVGSPGSVSTWWRTGPLKKQVTSSSKTKRLIEEYPHDDTEKLL